MTALTFEIAKGISGNEDHFNLFQLIKLHRFAKYLDCITTCKDPTKITSFMDWARVPWSNRFKNS